MKNVNVVITILILIIFICISPGFCEPFQLYIEPLSSAVIAHPLKLKLFVLNEFGETDNSFTGKKPFKANVTEPSTKANNSYSFNPKKLLKFKKGVSELLLSNTEEEIIEIKISIDEVKLPGLLNISFEDMDVDPPEIKNIKSEEPNILILEFDEELDLDSAINERNYNVISNKREEFPSKVEFNKDYVVLTLPDPFKMEEKGYVELNNIKDLAGNEVESGLQSPEFDGDCGCID